MLLIEISRERKVLVIMKVPQVWYVSLMSLILFYFTSLSYHVQELKRQLSFKEEELVESLKMEEGTSVYCSYNS